MSEGIEYHPTGTIDVTFDDKTYHLGRPKLRQWRYFTRKIDEITTKATEDLADLMRRVVDAQAAILEDADGELSGTYDLANERSQSADATRAEVQAREVAWTHVYETANEELRGEYDAAQAAMSEFAETPFYFRSSELVREIFKQLADDPLPDDIDDWPAWLATDVRLPGTLLGHWRNNPKASGLNGSR